jgi:magnesium transporter
VVALVFFLPLLIGSAGNAGSQSATLTVRALATGDVESGDWWRLLAKELLVAFLLGSAMALSVGFLAVIRVGWQVAGVVSLTMLVLVLMGSLIGMSLPFLLRRLGLDPATASGPLVTSLSDIGGVLIYFSLATWLLGIAMD